MPQAITAFIIFVVVAGGIIIVLSRRTREKMHETAVAQEAMKPKEPRSLSKRQQRIVSTLEPEKELPSIEDLVAQEALDTGVDDIRGGDGLDTSLKLRVFWRDETVRKGCTDGILEFRVEEGVAREEAETDDVRLVCVRSGGGNHAPSTGDDDA